MIRLQEPSWLLLDCCYKQYLVGLAGFNTRQAAIHSAYAMGDIPKGKQR
ncbi:hypothetical protein XNA1_720029 [Xenorhabdus nematophila str. Anatoliense]|nr:hypothetical protein XNA1_1950028 [Xenorhabdus nematophila str. Anatoliense]CEE95868.1 hypothetical protein XNA1_720029 [Xenorhabdus nematophila str. Anatoliense]